jgi:hypothetical protein
LVRRVLWEHEIVGSSPATPTTLSVAATDADAEPETPHASPIDVGEAVRPPRDIEVVVVGDEKAPEGERDLGLFMTPTGEGGGGLFTPMNSLKVGPGEPGPGDDWEFPTEPIDGAVGENVPATQPPDPTDAEPRHLDR